MLRNLSRRFLRLDRHDVRSSLPAAIQAIMQNGLLYRSFEQALVPEFLFPAIAERRPWAGGLGDTTTFTRPGLLTPVTTALTVGSDPGASTYTFEQYSATMSQYAGSLDTNMLQSAMTLASKFIEDTAILAVQAGQSLNRLARSKLYAAYGGGKTWCTSIVTSTTIVVKDTTGFGTVLVNGVPTPVSAGNPLPITVNGVANNVTGVTDATHLVLSGSITTAVGQAVLSSIAPVTILPAACVTRADLVGGNIATLAMFRAAVARLRAMAVPTVGGYYVAHIDATTETQLYADTDFKQALTGRVDSKVYRDLSIGTFAGIDWVRNIEAPTTADGGGAGTGSLVVHRPIVVGAGALLSCPFSDTARLLHGTDADSATSGVIELIGPANGGVQVAHIVRPAQDRLQQVISSTWSFIGDFAVPSDSLTGSDLALYKRGVVLEHL